MKRGKRALALLLALVLAPALTACGGEHEPEPEPETLNVAWETLNGKFSPFYAETTADRDAMELTQLRLLSNDRAGMVVYRGIEGETIPYNGTDYTYYGPADLTVAENPDGTVWYDFTLREALCFSDGTPLTVDDLIFSLYVLCDPAYNGPSKLNTMPIQGLRDYRLNNISLSALLARLGEDNTDFSLVTEAQQTAFWEAVNSVLVPLAQELQDRYEAFTNANLEEDEEPVVYTPARTALQFGWELPEDTSIKDLALFFGAQFGWDFEKLAAWLRDGIISITGLPEQLGEVYGYSNITVTSGAHAARISGIQKTGENSLRIVADRLDVSMLYYLGSVYIAPLHYYGDAALYDYDNDSFGFPKGDLSGVRAKTEQPLGAGPYRLVEYQNGEVTYEANERYYLGAPKIERISLRSDQNSYQKLENLARGSLDISWFSAGCGFDQALIDSLEGTVTFLYADEIHNPTYQYIGLNPKTVNVAGAPGSEASKCLRRALATVIAACREDGLAEAREKGLVTQAHVIEYPISNTSWAAVQPGEAEFKTAFSEDVNGTPIYTEDMTEEERDTAAAEAALGFFAAAGYTVEEGRLTAAPEGAALSYEVQLSYFPQSDGGCVDPVWLTMQRAREILSALGMELTLVNTFETEEMGFPAVGECDLWWAVWGDANLAGLWCEADKWNDWYAVTDPAPHFREICYADAANGGANPGAYQSVYGVSDPELDQLILAAGSTADQTRRRALYRQCLEIVQDWACEVPFSQDRDTLAYAAGRIREGTLPGDLTGHYGWMREIHRLELN